jgi:hypothetical protein
MVVSLTANSTICFKKSITDISSIESIKLDGGECKANYSLNEMKNQGFKVIDINVKEKNNKLDVVYILKKQQINQQAKKPIIKPAIPLNLNTKNIKIISVQGDTATIALGNLRLGQSGIILHDFSDAKSAILAYATIVSTDKEQSTIKFLETKIIPQDALPTTNITPKAGDRFIINHLYKASLMIVPNFEAEQKVKRLYKTHKFLNSDIFAGYLKINDTPVPTKETIQNFAKDNDLGTVLFHIENNLYLVDTITFKVIHKQYLPISDKSFISPFLTNVKNIITSTFDFTSLEKIENYDEYYKELLGL